MRTAHYKSPPEQSNPIHRQSTTKTTTRAKSANCTATAATFTSRLYIPVMFKVRITSNSKDPRLMATILQSSIQRKLWDRAVVRRVPRRIAIRPTMGITIMGGTKAAIESSAQQWNKYRITARYTGLAQITETPAATNPSDLADKPTWTITLAISPTSKDPLRTLPNHQPSTRFLRSRPRVLMQENKVPTKMDKMEIQGGPCCHRSGSLVDWAVFKEGLAEYVDRFGCSWVIN